MNRARAARRRCFLVLVDGLGIGKDSAENPFTSAKMPFVSGMISSPLTLQAFSGRDVLHLSGCGIRLADATLGFPGEPQSGTGQGSLLSGVNLAKVTRGHVGGRPSPLISSILKRHNLFLQLKDLGKRCTFVNAFRPSSFTAMEQGRYVPSATTTVARSAGLKLKTFDDLFRGEAVYHDIAHWYLRENGHGVPERAPEEAGTIAAGAAGGFDLALFEYFLTDLAGHRRDRSMAVRALQDLDRFLSALCSAFCDSESIVVLCSDHGNVEDMSTARHTASPVPVAAFGGTPAARRRFVDSASSIAKVAPAILRYLAGAPGKGCEGHGDFSGFRYGMGLDGSQRLPGGDTAGRASVQEA